MKYRIYQDCNGAYIIKRKKFILWENLDFYEVWGGEWANKSPLLFASKEAVVEFLNKIERNQTYTDNAKIFTLITEIDANKIPPLCSNCQKEIEEIAK